LQWLATMQPGLNSLWPSLNSSRPVPAAASGLLSGGGCGKLRSLKAHAVSYLEEAVVAYRSALEEYTREGAPAKWAKTQSALGNALRALGERDGGTSQLEKAVEAFDAALSIYASPGLEHYRQTCQTNRDRAVALRNQRLGPNRDLDAAK
jgi:hypothetical protein